MFGKLVYGKFSLKETFYKLLLFSLFFAVKHGQYDIVFNNRLFCVSVGFGALFYYGFVWYMAEFCRI